MIGLVITTEAVIDVERQLADGHLVALFQPAVGLEHATVDAVFAPVLLQPADPEAVGFVRPLDRHAKLFRERTGLAAMIDMAVGDQNLLDGHAVLRRRRLETRQIAARIDADPGSLRPIGTVTAAKGTTWTVTDLGGTAHQVTVPKGLSVATGTTVSITGTADASGAVTATAVTVRATS